ncbi:hypothetical protein ASESINO_27 [Erwinia phage vB_EamM_Asesino]|uniref:Uncharacterized protein n=1 Tax=Erwinia phage vB_EamM_Asesino TaxID=1883370 RepID=A0A1B2I9W2_9CAUD|nr:hypothetical protein ASESINO_27 [Erwinia phage vB_EamM_Asesino]ANZ48040.1 hypothetical protein ASESINO_27 [Erwinia phage vB_EamM_Asesino]
MTPQEKQTVTVQLLHTALEDIFYSIPEQPNCRLPDHLEPFVDAFDLSMALVADQLIAPPKRIQRRTMMVSHDGLGSSPMGYNRQEVAVLKPTRYLLGIAFEPCYDVFLDEVENVIKAAFIAAKQPFNRYATVEVEPHLTPRGQVASLELKIGEDIRFIHYRKSFPNKRYRPHDAHRPYREQGVSEDFE